MTCRGHDGGATMPPHQRIEFRAVMSRVPVLAALLPVAIFAAGCGGSDNADVVAGKQLFVKKCGSCHVLNRAGTKGTTGPNLDEAFQRAEKDGFGESAIRGVIKKQIEYPNRDKQAGGIMPAKLVDGQDADDVASYVASVVAHRGKDTGLLANAVPNASAKVAVAKNGAVAIDADPGGQLLFTASKATSPPGKLTINFANTSGVAHNIAISGKGKTPITPNGKGSFTATYAAGTYTYICEVPGHAEAGMKGTLTVK
jgi:plastocyanin